MTTPADAFADVERHSVVIYTSKRGAWAVCECGWHSQAGSSAFFAQTVWNNHVSAVLREVADQAEPVP